jgi:hypothetical protein
MCKVINHCRVSFVLCTVYRVARNYTSLLELPAVFQLRFASHMREPHRLFTLLALLHALCRFSPFVGLASLSRLLLILMLEKA